jgi:hypothetical protein
VSRNLNVAWNIAAQRGNNPKESHRSALIKDREKHLQPECDTYKTVTVSMAAPDESGYSAS